MAIADRNLVAGDGEMARRIRAYDWAATPFGPIETWPQSLKTTVDLLLASGFPMIALWGPRLIQIYNDGYRTLMDRKHPVGLGQPTQDCWPEVWHINAPIYDRVWAGETLTFADALYPISRHGALEDAWFTLAYSPLRDEAGAIAGVLVTVVETTAQVLSERRLRTLRELAARTATDRAADACAVAAAVLADNPADVPYALIYLLDADGGRARLAAAAGLAGGTPASPTVVDFGAPVGAESAWPLQAVAETGEAIVLSDLRVRVGDLPGGLWPQSPETAVVAPLTPADRQPIGLLVVGVSPRLALDDAYRGFLDLVANQVATAIGNAQTLERERQRAGFLDQADEAIFAWTWDGPIAYWNKGAERLYGYAAAEAVGQISHALLRTAHPGGRDAFLRRLQTEEIVEAEVEQTRRDGVKVVVATRHQLIRDGDRLLVLEANRDITQRKAIEAALRANEERQTFLLELSDALRSLADPLAIQAEASRIVGARMQTDRAYYVEIDYERGLAIVGRDYVGGDVPSLAGSHPLASFSSVLAPLENGRPFVAADAATDPHISDVDRVACATRALRSFVAMPLIKAGQLVAAFCVTDAEPRTWAEDDVGLLHDVAERTWDAVERARAEAAVRESEVKLALDLADARRLQRVSTQLIQEDDIELLYAQIVDAAVALMRADCGSMQMFFPERNELLLLTEKGLAPESAAFWKWVRADSASVCGAALAGGKRVIVPDIETCAFMVDTDDLSYSRLSGIRAVQSTPLLSRDGRAVGMISTHWRDVHEPADRELRLVDVLARQAADLIERRRADEAVRESEQRLQRAIEIETVGVVYFRTDGAITYANDAFLRMSGYSRDDVARGLLRWDTTTPPEWMPATLRAMDELVESGRISPYEKEYLRKDGSRWWTLCAGTRLSEDEGVKFVLDLTEAKRLEAAHAAVLDAVAHDVKNPLTTIAGQAQLIERDLARDTIDLERVQGRAAAIAAGARRATDLLDDLTDAARLRVGKPLALQPAPVDLVSLVEAAATTQQSATDRHTIAVEAAVASLPGVWDAARIRRVLDNLLGNAIKYSPDGGPVTVRVRRDDGPDGAWAEVAVVDRGVGIPASDLPRIFEPFHRGGNVAQRIAGSGIGLNGARQIVEQHGGTIAATSVEGQGSVFTARLPLAPDAG